MDTVAAGDCFNGAFAVALLEGRDPVGGGAIRQCGSGHFRYPARRSSLNADAAEVDAFPGQKERSFQTTTLESQIECAAASMRRQPVWSLRFALGSGSSLSPHRNAQDTQYRGAAGSRFLLPLHEPAQCVGRHYSAGCPPFMHERWLADSSTGAPSAAFALPTIPSRYDLPALQWTQSSFIQPQMMVQDRYFYDPVAGKYTVDRYLDDLDKRYGGIDAVLVWSTYPNMGVDDRNQLEMVESMPGGIEGVRQMVADFHRRGVRVLFPMMMWDQGTHEPGKPWPRGDRRTDEGRSTRTASTATRRTACRWASRWPRRRSAIRWRLSPKAARAMKRSPGT